MTREARLERIASRSWYHSIEIEPGLVTPGAHPLRELRQVLAHLKLPASLDGQSVLDIGAWDGFFSFEAERRGASRVVAYDVTPADYFGFSTARELLGSAVEYVQGSVYDLSRDTVGTYDIVLFAGVFYHLRYPLLALDRIHDVCDGYMVLESHCLDDHVILDDGQVTTLERIDPRLSRVPLYRFYPGNELNRDYSNWFSPNRRAIEEGLRTAGFTPTLLSQWGDRVAYRGDREAGVPEYLQETYEGLFVRDADGVVRNTYPRARHPRSRPAGPDVPDPPGGGGQEPGLR
jgi:tRNA (mo5U34)-methyltransferase